jgi:hypothetical protein
MARSLTRSDAVRAIGDLRDELDKTLDEIEEQRRQGNLSAEHQAYLNDYAAVRMAGYLEQLCFHAISGRIGEISSGSPQTFINSWFYKAPNLTADQFRALFKRFGPEADARVMRFLDDGLNRDLLNNLLETRNSVAHGKENSQVGRQSLQTFRALVAEVEKLVEDLLLGDSAVI